MAKATERQMDYAKHISETLGIDLPKTQDRFVIGAFINEHKEAASFKQEENNRQIYDRIKREIPITDIAKEMGYTLKKDGRYYTFEEHDSVHINPETNLYIRSSEPGNQGSVIDFVQHFGKMEKREAIEMLAARIGSDPYLGFTVQPVPKEVTPFVLPEKGQNMRNVYAYLTQSRYIDPDVVQYFVDRKMLYQDSRKNCVFVSYKDDEPVFACLKGTNTFTPFQGDVPGSDYSQCWYLDNQAERLYVTEAPIDTMSRMSMFLKMGKDLQGYDYLAMSSATKYESVIARAKEKHYKEIIVGTDNDKAGKLAFEKIRKDVMGMGLADGVTQDLPQITKDWNDELKYLFIKRYRYEHYFEPTGEQLDVLDGQMQALATGDTGKYQSLQMQLPHLETAGELRNYMLNYLDKNYDKAIEDFKSGSKKSILDVMKNYNKQIKLSTKSTEQKINKGIEL